MSDFRIYHGVQLVLCYRLPGLPPFAHFFYLLSYHVLYGAPVDLVERYSQIWQPDISHMLVQQ